MSATNTYTSSERRFIADCPDGPAAGRREVARLRAAAARFPEAPAWVAESFAALWAWEQYADFRARATAATTRAEQVALGNEASRIRAAHTR